MTAIVSFTIALLPFLDPIEADIKKYETIYFGNTDTETAAYIETFAKDSFSKPHLVLLDRRQWA